MMLILGACLAACGLPADTEGETGPDAAWGAATQPAEMGTAEMGTGEASRASTPVEADLEPEVPNVEASLATDLSLPALRSRIDQRLDAGEPQAALDDMDVFVFRFAAAPSSERYRALLTANDREIRERTPLRRRLSRGLPAGLAPMRPAPPRPPRARVRMMPPRVQGAIPQAVVHRAMRRHMGEVRNCYERMLNRRPDLGGRLGLQIVVTEAGQVLNAAVTENTTGDGALAQCVRLRVRRWRFPRNNAAGVVMVQARLLFTTE